MLHSLDSQDFFFEAVVTVNMSALLVLATMFIGSKIKKLGNLITLCLYSQSDLADHVLCEDDWDLVDLQPLHPLHGGAPSYLHGFPQVRCSKSFLWMHEESFKYHFQLWMMRKEGLSLHMMMMICWQGGWGSQEQAGGGGHQGEAGYLHDEQRSGL